MRDFSHLNVGKFSEYKIWGIIVSLGFLIAGGISFFVLYFSISTVSVPRNEEDLNLPYGKIRQTVEVAKGENLLFLSSDFLKKQITLRFPELGAIAIEKKYPNTLLIRVETKPVVMRFVYSKVGEETQYVGFLNEDGVFFDYGNPDLFTIYDDDKRSELLRPLDRVFEKEEILKILEGKESLESIIGQKIGVAELHRNAQEIYFVDEKEVKYWVFLGKSFEEQFENLKNALEEKDIYQFPLEYIDLRIGRKVIYKPK